MVTTTYKELTELFRLTFPCPLSILVAEIIEVFPAGPATAGSRQQLRIGNGRTMVDLHCFDQQQAVPHAAVGSFIRLSAPSSTKGLVVERSKASKPMQNIPAVVARKACRIELIQRSQAEALAGGCGFALAQVVTNPLAEEPPRSPERRVVAAPKPAAHGQLRATAVASVSPMEVARSVAECLAAARVALGEHASDEDIRFAAKLTFDEVRRRDGDGSTAPMNGAGEEVPEEDVRLAARMVLEEIRRRKAA